MEVKLVVNVGGVDRALKASVDSLKDLEPALRRLDMYLRLKVQRRFDQAGPGWPALHKRSAERNMQKKTASLGNKLHKDVERAWKKAKNITTVARRKTVLAEFKRLVEGGDSGNSLLTPKLAAKLGERMGRARDKATKPLGRLASSIKSEVKRGRLRVFSEVEWAGVHNEGGDVGRGAKVPKREFLTLEEDDVEALAAFILDEVVEKGFGG